MAKGVFQVALSSFDCAGCFKTMEDKLNSIQGILSVKAFPQLGRVRIEYKEAAINSGEIAAVIENLGFPVESKKLN